MAEAKNGSTIPLRGTISFHSKYNPEREAEQFASQYSASGENCFFIVQGLCGGFHIQALKKRFPKSTVVAIENTKDDIQFLRQIPTVQAVLHQNDVFVLSEDEIQKRLPEIFIPAAFDSISVIALRSWENAFPAQAEAIKTQINKTISAISADFSVQSHFGGIWQRNILVNVKTVFSQKMILPCFPTKKTAAVIAAGPSLDETYAEILKKRDDFFVIATDTGYRALLRRGITSDAVICVDAQMISHAHFFEVAPDTLCIFDISANPATVRRIAQTNSVFFIQTGHPLSAWVSQKTAHFLPQLTAGSGTVTVTAAAFAVHAGFERIRFFGADFGYSRGKAYTKGSYLDDLYNTTANRLRPAESQFAHLLLRTELKQTGTDFFTTDLLSSYGQSLAEYMKVNNFIKKADTEYIRTENVPSRGILFPPQKTNVENQKAYGAFASAYSAALHDAFAGSPNKKNAAFITLLPYIAWLKRRFPQDEFEKTARLAYKKTLEYIEEL